MPCPTGLQRGPSRFELAVVPSGLLGASDAGTRAGAVWDADVPPIAGTPIRQELSESRLGSEFTLDLQTEAGALCATYYAQRTGYTPLLGQPVLLDVFTAVFLFSGATAADGTLRFFTPIPADPTLVDLTLFFQSFALLPGGGFAVSETDGRRIGL